MILWRLSSVVSLDGKGGLLAAGRWHGKGRRIVYTSEHPEGALLEVLVHLGVARDEFPTNLRLLEISVPDAVRTRAPRLKPGWEGDLVQSRRIGDDWLQRGDTALLRIPSAILPQARNVLINPLHADARAIRIVSNHPFRLDARLIRRS